MTEAEARARLERMVAPDMAPTLATEDIDDLMVGARRPDTSGLLPSDAEWTPTWDLDAAAARGWEIKAGLAAGDYNFAASGQRFDRSQVHDACMKMAALYTRGSGSSRVSSGAVDDYAAAMVEGLTPGVSIL